MAGAAGAGGDGTSSVTRTRLTAEASPRGRNRKRRRLPTDLSANPRARERARRTRPRRRSASRGSPKAWASQRAWGQTRGPTASSVSFFPPKGSGPTTSCKRPFPRRRPRAERAQDASETAPLRAPDASPLLSSQSESRHETGTGPAGPQDVAEPGQLGPCASAVRPAGKDHGQRATGESARNQPSFLVGD